MLSYLQQRRFLAEQCVDRKGFVSVSPTVRPCRSEAYKRDCRRNFKCLSISRVVCLFTTITIKPLSGNCLFSIAVFYKNDLRFYTTEKRGRKIEEYKRQYLPHFYSDLGLMVQFYNRLVFWNQDYNLWYWVTPGDPIFWFI